ncbi:MAG TPA: lipocalin family protein [Terracidiphilus sp.]|nr:lipocalin family protein [Terracidiphilus sp.]
MKTLLSICAALALTLGTASVRAADVTGTWSAEMKTPDGNSFPLTFTFKQDGATLTGTVQGPQGDPTGISNGKIDGDKFSFDVSFNGMTIHHNCTVTGDDEIKMTTKSDTGDFPGMELTLKRVKPVAPAAPSGPDTPAKPSQPPQ